MHLIKTFTVDIEVIENPISLSWFMNMIRGLWLEEKLEDIAKEHDNVRINRVVVSDIVVL